MRYEVEFIQQLEALLHDAGFICTEHGVETGNAESRTARTENMYRRGLAWVRTSYYTTPKKEASFTAFVPKFRICGPKQAKDVNKLAERIISAANSLDRKHAALNALADQLAPVLEAAGIPFLRVEKKERIHFKLDISPALPLEDADSDAKPDLFTLKFNRPGAMVLQSAIFVGNDWRIFEDTGCAEPDDGECEDDDTPRNKVETLEDCLRVIRDQHDRFKKFLICANEGNGLIVTLGCPGEYLQYMLDLGVLGVGSKEHTVRSTTGNATIDGLLVKQDLDAASYKVTDTRILFKQPFVGEPNE
ncbi:hypothetical protein LU11_gp271 [Pseudomonas phage Lu11]|uniref:hypothetical protein n=1 Tax=Pseudomonas phage Lu11 TaxID=1161927 RepID=UPI00025F1836|nr:hypothetical protein LU11_gp271 [Pseudomonas phage Lu11]AFH14802.1 hypothetical protein Lu11_0265 [Pseudomonas phage Lu11]